MVEARSSRDGGAGASTRGGSSRSAGVDAAEEAAKSQGRKPTKKEAKALAVRVETFKRGPKVAVKHIKDKKLRGQMQHSEKLLDEAASSAAKVRAPPSASPRAPRPAHAHAAYLSHPDSALTALA